MPRSRIPMPQALAAPFAALRARAEERARAEGREATPWYRLEAKDDGTAEVFIYEEISWFGITAMDFIGELKALGPVPLTVHINSPGGLVDDGIAIYNALADHPAHVTTIDDSGAYSIASVIFMAGDRRVMNRASSLMIHDALSGLDILGWFNPADLVMVEKDVRDLRMVLDKFSDIIAGVYADRAGGTPAEWREAMRATTWYTAEEAVAAGLADEVVAGAGTQAAARWHAALLFSAFRNVPQHVQRERRDGAPRTKREVEQALRDAGMSASAAKAIASRGVIEEPGAARDEQQLRDLAAQIRSMAGA